MGRETEKQTNIPSKQTWNSTDAHSKLEREEGSSEGATVNLARQSHTERMEKRTKQAQEAGKAAKPEIANGRGNRSR